MPSVRGLLVGCVVLCMSACSKVDFERERAAILATDGPWQQAIAARDVDRAVSFWADDAVVMPAGQASLVGKSAIRGFVSKAFKIPGFGLRWETSSVQVASSGDLAYALAKTTTTFTGPDGKQLVVPGKAATVWRKAADGHWSCVVDIWNDDVLPKQ